MDDRLRTLGTTSSTNDDVHAAAEEGAPDGTVIVADTMTTGRGSRGRTWHAETGGLWLSILRRLSAPAGSGVLSLRVGLAVARAVEDVVDRPVALKWPNDLLLGGRKVGGVLCEMRWQGQAVGWVAIGVGLNVANRLPAELAHGATRMADHVPGTTSATFLAPVVEALRAVDVERDRLDPTELEAFAERDWLRSKALMAPVRGVVEGITASGALEVRRSDGQREVLHSAALTLA